MSQYEREPSLSEWDTKHFGVRIASFGPKDGNDLTQGLEWARDNSIEMLMARCDTSNVPILHRLESAGFLTMDTFVRYAFDLTKREIPEDTGSTPVRSFASADIPIIGRLARRAFKRYRGHFHNDPKLPRDRCDAVYSEWAMNSCREKRLADEVLVADPDGEILGFATLKGLGEGAAEGILFAVDPKAQGMGIYRTFMIQGMRWCAGHGFERMEVDSQVNNYPVQRVWERLGFEIYGSGHTLHLWLKK